MSAERLQQLHALLAEEPGDAFLRYAIALELKRLGRAEEALHWLAELNRDEPTHVPTYYQLALLLAEADRREEAMAACEAGALRALVAGDPKARAELMALKLAIGDEA